MTEAVNGAERPRRILEAATELLTCWGYRKVTVEEIATRAGISKSAVYLHWCTKDDVFAEVLIQEGLDLLSQVSASIRREPLEVRPHRLVANYLLGVGKRPLSRALHARDGKTLGPLAEFRSARLRAYEENVNDLQFQYYQCLADNDLLRPGTDVRIAMCAAREMFRGMISNLHENDLDGQALRRMATVIACTVKRAFEPLHDPPGDAVARAAEVSCRLFSGLLEPGPALEPQRTQAPLVPARP